MVTLKQIEEAHSEVKSGAGFPAYIKQIKELGVKYYEVFVEDGRTEFLTKDGDKITAPSKYDRLIITDKYHGEQFKEDLKAHQQGKTDYFAFCSSSAKLGIEKWVVDTKDMNCTYYSKTGDIVLVENIPQ
ncbi:DUF1398 domain-containing protein [Pedobacter metabolipauper]|uniref:Uncharacterized protein YbcV (DUF1398 family) n=1 Tax=Pedobacter metabolipauper TaxID=425513 RepID=A0A4R6SVQ9_9SPHI|nr:DUF1398 family protein [Pedobacter metabolipauper]TDQ09471.1 uncharacterized protein YbcV (DUF1398 family) [Pedobacter metabolipauper]